MNCVFGSSVCSCTYFYFHLRWEPEWLYRYTIKHQKAAYAVQSLAMALAPFWFSTGETITPFWFSGRRLLQRMKSHIHLIVHDTVSTDCPKKNYNRTFSINNFRNCELIWIRFRMINYIQGGPERMQHLRSIISKKRGTEWKMCVHYCLYKFFPARWHQDR